MLNKNTLVRCSGLLVALSVLSGCGLLKDKTEDYIYAGNGPGLVVPEALENERINQPEFPIPRIDQRKELSAVPKLEIPAEDVLSTGESIMAMESFEEQEWLALAARPSQVWPALIRYWQDLGVAITDKNPRLGVLQTGVLNRESRRQSELLANAGAQSDRSYRFIFKLSQGVKRNTSELQVRVVDEGREPLDWVDVPIEESVEHEVLADFMHYLEENDITNTYSLVAQDIGGKPKAVLAAQDEDNPFLRLELNYDRAWSTVGQALAGANYKIHDINRSNGVYFINIEPPQRKRTGPLRFIGIGRKKEIPRDDPRFAYRVNLERQTSHIVVTVLGDEGGAVRDREQVVEILTTLLENIS